MTIDDLFDRRVPAAIALALLIQGGAVIWWASAKDADVRFQQQRLDHVEQTLSDQRASQSEILQRLARIEERLDDQILLLKEMTKPTGKERR